MELKSSRRICKNFLKHGFTILFLAWAPIMLLTACGGTSTDFTNATNSSATTPPPPPSPPPPSPPPPPPPSPDTTAPSLSIAGQTTSADKLTVTGTASDNVGVTAVTWVNSLGGSGTATTTNQWANWSASGITLMNGSNIITATARDAAGNTKTASVTVNYTPLATNQALLLSWNPNPASDAVLGYLVFHGPTASSATQQISDISVSSGVINPNAPAVNYNAGFDLGLKPGDPVCFRLMAYNSVGSSGFSGEACTTI